MPGKADVVTVYSNSGKIKMQKRHLVMTVAEAYQTFKSEFPNYIIGKSKFASMRPKNVLLTSDMPQNVCGCKYRSNIILLLGCLHRQYPQIFPTYSDEFVSNCVCNSQQEACMFNKCGMCKDFRLFTENFTSKLENTDDSVTWYQWNQDNDSYLVKELQEGSVQDAIDLISSQLIAFLQHVYIKRQQAISYESQKADAQLPASTSCILQMDFEENYTATFQDEIQSVHWKQKQITVYTIMIWHHSEIISKIFVSDCRDHEKHS